MLTFTPESLPHLQKLKQEEATEKTPYVRFAIIPESPTGLEYAIGCDCKKEDDIVVKLGFDLEVILDPASTQWLDGCEVHYDGKGVEIRNQPRLMLSLTPEAVTEFQKLKQERATKEMPYIRLIAQLGEESELKCMMAFSCKEEDDIVVQVGLNVEIIIDPESAKDLKGHQIRFSVSPEKRIQITTSGA